MRILVNEYCGHAFQIELSRELARRGHSVLHVYFADNKSTPKGDVESGTSDPSNFAIEGLHIPQAFAKHSIRTRRQADISYGKAVAARVAEFEPDVVISANTPLDAQSIVQKATLKRNAKFVFWLQDVYSQAVRFVLTRKLGPLGRIGGAYYEHMEKQLFTRSDAVICISPGFKEIATAWGVEPSRAFVIENWAPLGEVVPTGKENSWAEKHDVSAKLCFMYSGTLGMKHRPELLLALARSLETVGGAKLVVIAGGAGADWLKENAQQVSKDALTLLPFQPYNDLSAVLGSSDVLIALLDSEAGAFAVPSKILSYLCAGRTLMVAAPPENHVAAVMEQAEAGIVVSPDHVEEFVSAAHLLMENVDLRKRYAANARAYAERSFDIGLIADRFVDVFSASQTRHGAMSPQIAELAVGDRETRS